MDYDGPEYSDCSFRGTKDEKECADAGCGFCIAAILMRQERQMQEVKSGPEGKLTLQAMAMPKNTNPNGDIFGGWLLSQMDLAGGILAFRASKGRAATIAIDKMCFKHPVAVGDLVKCYSKLLKTGKTSMTIKVEAWVEDCATEEICQVTEGVFTFVAIDGSGKKREIIV